MTTTHESRCAGHCCREFIIHFGGLNTPDDIATHIRERTTDGPVIADMLIFLRPVVPGTVMPSGAVADHSGGWVCTCKHWDEATGNCGIYATRPSMCRDYPYGEPCKYKECAWDVGKAGAWPPPKVHYAVDKRCHLVTLDAAGHARHTGYITAGHVLVMSDIADVIASEGETGAAST